MAAFSTFEVLKVFLLGYDSPGRAKVHAAGALFLREQKTRSLHPFHQIQGDLMKLHRSGMILAIAGGLWVTVWSLHEKPAGAGDDRQATSKDNKSELGQKKEDAEKKPTPKKVAMKLFMRKKLEASQSLLEGL